MTSEEGRESESVVDTPRVSLAQTPVWLSPTPSPTPHPGRRRHGHRRITSLAGTAWLLRRETPPGASLARRRGMLIPDNVDTRWTATSSWVYGQTWVSRTEGLAAEAKLNSGAELVPKWLKGYGLRGRRVLPCWTSTSWRGMNACWSHGAERLGPPAERATQRFRRGSPMARAPYTHGAERFGPRSERAPQRLPDVEEPIHSWGAEVYTR